MQPTPKHRREAVLFGFVVRLCFRSSLNEESSWGMATHAEGRKRLLANATLSSVYVLL